MCTSKETKCLTSVGQVANGAIPPFASARLCRRNNALQNLGFVSQMSGTSGMPPHADNAKSEIRVKARRIFAIL